MIQGKINWASHLYIFICRDRLINKDEIEKTYVEKVLFLMQYDSLEKMKDLSVEKNRKLKKPFYPFKIHIEGNRISVSYISDLMRVSKLIGESGIRGARSSLILWQSFDRLLDYTNISKKYFNMSHNEIDERVLDIVKNNYLDSKYFVRGKYSDKYMRIRARLWAYQEDNFIMMMVWFFWMALAIGVDIALLVTPFVLKNNGLSYFSNQNEWISYFVVGFILNIIFVFWTKYVLKPTQFEIDNGYVD